MICSFPHYQQNTSNRLITRVTKCALGTQAGQHNIKSLSSILICGCRVDKLFSKVQQC